MKITIKCTTCKKREIASAAQLTEAKSNGCYFSSCCHTVATVVGVEHASGMPPRRRNRERWTQNPGPEMSTDEH